MKHCTKCDTTRDLNEFGSNSSRRDGKQVYCRSCIKNINALYYKRTPEKNNSRKASNERHRKAVLQFIWNYFSSHPCVDCGERDPIVLQFDHVREQKSFNISDSVRLGYHIETVASEIEKCDVRCANCHTRMTAKAFRWYSSINQHNTPS